MKEYACTHWPFYDLGKGIRFEDGRFATDDPGQQEIIESNDKYMVFVWPVSPPAEKEVVDDKACEGGIPTPQQDDREAPRPSEIEPDGSVRQGREESPVFQELEDIVRGSGIVAVKSAKVKPAEKRKGR